MVQTLEERDGLKRLRKELKELKVAYADLATNYKISQKVIEVADDMLGLDLKKVCTGHHSTQRRSKGEKVMWIF
jgi:hypothetical protein